MDKHPITQIKGMGVMNYRKEKYLQHPVKSGSYHITVKILVVFYLNYYPL